MNLSKIVDYSRYLVVLFYVLGREGSRKRHYQYIFVIIYNRSILENARGRVCKIDFIGLFCK